jgi:hypothetical protein
MRIAEYLPLASFLMAARLVGAGENKWPRAFEVGAAVTLFSCLILMSKRRIPSPILMGISLFLFVGGLSFATGFSPLLRLYGTLMESALFISILFVGIVTTFASPQGFIGLAGGEPKRVRAGSYGLLAVAGLAVAASWHFHGRMFWAGVIPMVSLLLVSTVLRRIAMRGPLKRS